MNPQELRQHVVMSIFSMVWLSHMPIEDAAYVVGIKPETATRILQTCRQEYNKYVKTYVAKNRHLARQLAKSA